jgi:hypothetical protein
MGKNSEKSEYYWVEMNNGGYCIKYYKPSELEKIIKDGRKYKKIEGRR